MASEKVIGMMVEKGSPYSLEQLQGMEDRECWRWIYTHFPPKSSALKIRRAQSASRASGLTTGRGWKSLPSRRAIV